MSSWRKILGSVGGSLWNLTTNTKEYSEDICRNWNFPFKMVALVLMVLLMFLHVKILQRGNRLQRANFVLVNVLLIKVLFQSWCEVCIVWPVFFYRYCQVLILMFASSDDWRTLLSISVDCKKEKLLYFHFFPFLRIKHNNNFIVPHYRETELIWKYLFERNWNNNGI